MARWTEKQEEAISTRNANLLVSAAAGSGKTAILVERIIRLLTKEKASIDEFLIVTFTNAAAAEMRERIFAAIARELENSAGQDAHLRRQLQLLGQSSISTLHAFCIGIIRKHYHVLGLDPRFRVGDTAELTLLRKKALEEALEESYEKKDPDFLLLVEAYTENKGDQKLETLLQSVYDFIQSQPLPYEWLQGQTEAYGIQEEEFYGSTWQKALEAHSMLQLEGAGRYLEQALAICNHVQGPELYAPTLLQELEDLGVLKNKLPEYFAGKFPPEEMPVVFGKLKAIKKDSGVDIGLKERAQELRNAAKDIVKELFSKILSRNVSAFLSDVREMQPVLSGLYQAVTGFRDRFQQLKRERGVLDFNDLEHFALAILEDGQVADSLRKQYAYIFVDEYQDSNLVQEALVSRISRIDNLFFVGDVKQSIYRFRLADPGLFLKKYETYGDPADALHSLVNLGQNFRTRKEILEGINYVFRKLMSRSLGDLDYTPEVYLYPGSTFLPVENPEISLTIIQKKDDREENTDADTMSGVDQELAEMSNAETEAAYIAEKILALHGQDTYDNKKECFRPLNWRDMVILLRSGKNWSPVFYDTLHRRGIPVYVDDNAGYFDTLEIRIFMNLLAVLDNRRNDLALLAVMRSAFGGFASEELLAIRAHKKQSSFFDAAVAYGFEKNDDLSEKVSAFFIKIERWQEKSRFIRLDDFLWELMVESGYYYYCGSLINGEQRQANLKILVERAGQFLHSNGGGIFQFLRFAEEFGKASGEMGSAKIIGENEDVVRIMTIHKSKGLEFPVVFISALGRNFNLMDMRGEVLLHKELGIGARYTNSEKRVYRESLPQLAIKVKSRQESLSEEMRVLYVGMTRAKDRLFLLGTTKDVAGAVKRWSDPLSVQRLLKSSGFLDWLGAILLRHPDGEPLRKLLEIPLGNEELERDSSRWKIEIVNKWEVREQEENSQETKAEVRRLLISGEIPVEKELAAFLEERFAWQYPHASAIRIPSKITVSQMKHGTISEVNRSLCQPPGLLERPGYLAGEKPVTAAEKGTLLHYFMQHIPLKESLNREGLGKALNDMVERGQLTEKEAKVVPLGQVELFFASPLGLRMQQAAVVEREKSFVYPMPVCGQFQDVADCREAVFVQGVVDCYFAEKDGLVLVDYKSDFVASGEEELVAKYGRQVEIYREALEAITQVPVKEAWIYSFHTGKGIRIRRKEEQ